MITSFNNNSKEFLTFNSFHNLQVLFKKVVKTCYQCLQIFEFLTMSRSNANVSMKVSTTEINHFDRHYAIEIMFKKYYIKWYISPVVIRRCYANLHLATYCYRRPVNIGNPLKQMTYYMPGNIDNCVISHNNMKNEPVQNISSTQIWQMIEVSI